LKNRVKSLPAEATDVRFGMRGLLLTTTGVAVAAAGLGVFLRSLSPETRNAVLPIWGVFAVVVISCVGFCARMRLRLEREAGRKLRVLAPRGRLGIASQPWMITLGGLGWIAGGLYYLIVATMAVRGGPNASKGLESILLGVLPCIVCGAVISAGIAKIWWDRTVQLREFGALRGLRLLQWTHVTQYEWKEDAVILAGVDQRHRDVQFGVMVKPDAVKAVDNLLQQRLRERYSPRDGNVEPKENAAKSRPLVQLNTSQNVTLRGMATAFTVYALVCVLPFMLFRPLGPPSEEFLAGLLIGAGLVGLKLGFDAMQAKETGAPLVRLFTRVDWPSATVATLAGIGCYWISKQLLFPSMLMAAPFGIGSGLAASALAGIVMREKFDLCENGIVLVRWPFLPWERVRLLKWNRDGNGRLLLRCGWRRIAANVPAEHRAVVDRVLYEKLGARVRDAENSAVIEPQRHKEPEEKE
jgi:hypothetical protein